MSYQQIYTLKSGLQITNLLGDFDAFRYYMGTEGDAIGYPTSLQFLYDISYLSFNKNTNLDSLNAINMNSKTLININQFKFSNFNCKFFKISPNRDISFNNLRIINKYGTDISYILWEFDNTINSYTQIHDTAVTSSSTYVDCNCDNIILQLEPPQTIPYNIVVSRIVTNDIFTVNSQMNIKWRIYKSNVWNYTPDIPYGVYDISGFNIQLQNIELTNTVKIFDTSAIDITTNTTYPYFTFNFYNNYFTIIEISNDSSLFNYFTMINNSNIILPKDVSHNCFVKYEPYKDSNMNFTYTNSDDVTAINYNSYVDISNLDFNVPNYDLNNNDISNSLPDLNTRLFIIENTFLDISDNFIFKETNRGTFADFYESNYTLVNNITSDISYTNTTNSYISSTANVTTVNSYITDSSFIYTDDFYITNHATINSIDASNSNIYNTISTDISGLFTTNTLDISSNTSNYIDINKYKYKYVRFDFSHDASINNLKFYDYNDNDISFTVYGLSNGTYSNKLSDIDTSFNYNIIHNDISSIAFVFDTPQPPGLYYNYDLIDISYIFNITEDNNKIYYQPESEYDASNNYRFIKAELPIGTWSLADINKFLKEGLYDSTETKFDNSGNYNNPNYKISYSFVEYTSNISISDSSFNILSKSLFSSHKLPPLISFDQFNDTSDEFKILMLLESSTNESNRTLYNFEFNDKFQNTFINSFFNNVKLTNIKNETINDLLNNQNNFIPSNNILITSGFSNIATTIDVSNNDVVGVLLTINSSIIKPRNTTIDIYTVNDNLATDISSSNLQWNKVASDFKYKNKYSLYDQYEINTSGNFDYGTVPLYINYSDSFKNTIIPYNYSQIYIDDISFISQKLNDSSYSYLSIDKKINTTDLSCSNLYLPYNSNNDISSNNITTNNATFNNGLSTYFLHNGLGGGIDVKFYDYSGSLYDTDISNGYPVYDLSNSVVKMAYTTTPINDCSYIMNILSAPSHIHSDPSGSEAGWEITTEVFSLKNSDSNISYGRTNKNNNIRLVPSAIYNHEDESDPSVSWRIDTKTPDISYGNTCFQVNADKFYNKGGYYNLSDKRMKYKIKDISNGLNTINLLKPKSYYKTFDTNIPNNTINESGFIAQDILSIHELKHAVTNVDQILHLDYKQIYPYLCNAIQQLHSKIKTLKTRLDLLEN